MNILQVHKYYWPRDGASKYVLQLSDWLIEAGHTVIPLAMQESESLPSPYSQYFVSNLDLFDPSKLSLGKKIKATSRIFHNREAVTNLKALLKAQPIDVAHIHNIYHHISPVILPVLKKAGVKVVMTVHDYHLISPNYSLFHHGQIHEEDVRGWYLACVKNKCVKDNRAYSAVKVVEMIWQHKFKKYFENNVDVFIAPSQFMADMLIKHGYDKNKITVIPNPAEAGVKKSNQFEAGNYVGFAGRLSAEKGVSVLLDAAKALPEITFKIAGAGPEEISLKKKCFDLSLSNVEFVGFKSGQELEGFLAGAKISVVPSIWYENGPLSVLEPMARGQVVLASRIGGIPEMLPDELLFAPGNVAELAALIRNWHDASNVDYEAMGKKLAVRAQNQYNPELHVQKVLSVY